MNLQMTINEESYKWKQRKYVDVDTERWVQVILEIVSQINSISRPIKVHYQRRGRVVNLA